MSLKSWSRKKSPWLYHMDCGSCNGCSIEILAALSPRFDAERFGCLLKGTPRHADIILVTGPPNSKTLEPFMRTYKQVPDPKVVVAVGGCATGLEAYRGSKNVIAPVQNLIPVDVFVLGCPPKPEAILKGVLKAADILAEKK